MLFYDKQYWKSIKKDVNEMLVFDCKFTTYKVLDELNSDNVKFLTLRKRNATLLQKTSAVPEKEEWIKVYVPLPLTQRIG
jgi:hypothetical protein